MFRYSRKSIIILTIIISAFIYICIQINIICFQKSFNSKKEKDLNLIVKVSNNSINNEENNMLPNLIVNEENTVQENNEEDDINTYTTNNWRILIPKINLNAPILEGTTKENMRRGVTHFENSSNWNGNVCLAAHNRGYKYNYFQEIHTLEKGDILEYQTELGTKKYEVILNTKIRDDDWSYLENTTENKLTLITCVKDMPEFRVCVQAKEIL